MDVHVLSTGVFLKIRWGRKEFSKHISFPPLGSVKGPLR
jgi:hypothetical protein